VAGRPVLVTLMPMALPNRSPEVDAFLDRLDHGRLAAPNFRDGGEDRVTFRLHPRNQVPLVLHRGVRVADGQDPIRIPDPDGLLTWLSPDRAVLTLAGVDETQSRLGAVTALVGQWIRA